MGTLAFYADEPNPTALHFSRNFILTGIVTDGRNASAFANKPLMIYAFNDWQSLTAGPNGEYQMNFADTASFKPTDYWGEHYQSILFGWGKDPNFTHTQSYMLCILSMKKVSIDDKIVK